MDEKKMKKAGAAAVAVSVLSIGTIGAVSAYQSGIDFQPSDTDRELQTNQVVFSGDEDKMGKKKNDSSEESELWQKKQDEEKQKSPKVGENADYLFESGYVSQSDSGQSVGISTDNTDLSAAAGNTNGQPGQIYDITNNTGNADLIIGNGGQNGSLNSDALNPSQGNGNGTGSGENGSGTLTPGNGENAGGGLTPGGEEDPKPTVRPSSKVQDPPSNIKSNPSDGFFTTDSYQEGKVPGLDDPSGESVTVRIFQSEGESRSFLYKGQSIDKNKVYNSLETYVVGSNQTLYLWGSDALDKYIRIDAVSFDGGTTWNTEFPVTIPSDLGEDQMVIKVSYRLKMSESQWMEQDVSYAPAESCLFLLNRAVREDETTIDEESILNSSDLHPVPGTQENLYTLQWYLYGGADQITELFPGWMEDGEFVDWFYEVQAGRHILEPADRVPLSEEYTAKLQAFWMNQEGVFDPDGTVLAYLQTLTRVEHENRTHLKVPEYIQAVKIEDDAEVTTDYLEIPDTVLYIDESMSGLQVNEGYSVDESNPNYLSNEDGLLMDKEQEIIYAIPYHAEEVEVPSTIKKLKIAKKNQIRELKLEETDYDQMPEMTYQNLSDCQIEVKEEFRDQFLIEHWEEFGNNVTVSSLENPEETFRVERGMILNQNGDLHRATQNGSSVNLMDQTKRIEKGAFEDTEGIDSLVLAKNGTLVEFENGCFDGSSLKNIYCYTREQYDAAEKQLEESGIENISVALMQTSKEGYRYALSTEEGVETGKILDAPEDVTQFDGTVTALDGTPVTISAIGDSAFTQCKKLQWVTLPESVDQIGYMAFADCDALEGVLIDTKDTITIGNRSFDGCYSLRFLASNAMMGIMVDDYDPNVNGTYNRNQYFFYVPTGALGYTYHSVSFVEASGVTGYQIVSTGEQGKILYGLNAAGEPWLVLRSGAEMDEEVTLPATTIEIFSFAFEDALSPSGRFSLNLQDLPNFWGFDGGAMMNSDFSGDLVFPENVTIGDHAMAWCNGITSVEVRGEKINIGTGAFYECSNLKTATIGSFGSQTGMPMGIFEGCEQLTDLYFENEVPDYLVLNGSMKFQFNPRWSEEEELEHLQVHVPAGAEEAYAMEWRYAFAGYTDLWGNSAYQNMWDDVRFELIDYITWEFPEDEAVDALVKERLLEAENRARKLLGMSSVTEPTEFYPYRVDTNGMITMIGAPSYLTSVRLSGDALDLPDGWEADYIGTGMFKDAKQLKEVVFPSNLVGIENKMLEGVESESVTLRFESETPLQLLTTGDGTPFEFGIEDSKIHIEVPEGCEELYLENWQYPMAGYSDRAELESEVRADLTATKGEDPSDEEVEKEIENRLFDVNNRLRAMLGMELSERKEEAKETDGSAEDKKQTETDEASGKEQKQAETEAVSEKEKKPAETGEVSEDTTEVSQKDQEAETEKGEADQKITEKQEEKKPEDAEAQSLLQVEQPEQNESKETQK